MGQLWNLSGRAALATLAGLAVLEGYAGPAWSAPRSHGTAPAPPAATAQSFGRVSVDFVEADLGDIVKALSVQSGANVAVAAGVQGKVTVRLKGTTLEEALRLISRLAGVDYKRIGGTYVVGKTEDLRSLAARSGVSLTISLHYLPLQDAQDLARSAGPYVEIETRSQSVQLSLRGLAEDVEAVRAALAAADTPAAAPRSSTVVTPAKLKPKELADILLKAVPEVKCSVQERSVIVTGTAPELVLVQEVVKGADVPAGVSRTTRLYEIKYLHPTQTTDLLTKTFPNLTVLPGAEPLAPDPGSFMPLSVDSSKTFKSQTVTSNAGANGLGSSNGQMTSRLLILIGSPDDITQAVSLLEQTDVAPPQVMIEARVVESSPESFKNIGLQWDFGTTGVVEQPHSASSPKFNIGVLTRPPLNFQATINALIQTTNAKVLADPKIAVIDGEDASIFIGDTVRYRVLSSVSSGGQQIFDVKEVPVGIVLLCRPRVNVDGLVTLKVNPVVSTITAFVGPEQLPQTASREANSTIRVRDGETVVIGGLIQDQDRQTFSKVPLLGSLPIVGQLFRNNNHNHKRTDVTIFLTTHILKG